MEFDRTTNATLLSGHPSLPVPSPFVGLTTILHPPFNLDRTYKFVTPGIIQRHPAVLLNHHRAHLSRPLLPYPS